MSTAALYLITLLLLVVSFRTSRQKTRQALKKAWKSFEGILPQFLSILVLIGIILAVLDRDCRLTEGTKARALYGRQDVVERHRHRFELNNDYRGRL